MTELVLIVAGRRVGWPGSTASARISRTVPADRPWWGRRPCIKGFGERKHLPPHPRGNGSPKRRGESNRRVVGDSERSPSPIGRAARRSSPWADLRMQKRPAGPCRRRSDASQAAEGHRPREPVPCGPVRKHRWFNSPGRRRGLAIGRPSCPRMETGKRARPRRRFSIPSNKHAQS